MNKDNPKKYFSKLMLAFLASILVIFSASNPLYAQSSDVKLTPDEIAWIAENPVIRIANPSDIAPFTANNNGNVEGLAIDYINLLASKVGLEVELHEGSLKLSSKVKMGTTATITLPENRVIA